MQINKENIKIEFEQTFAHLIQLLGSFNDQEFNKIAFEGSWTAGQVAQHLKLANGNFGHVLNGNVENTVRSVDQHVASLKDIFLNFDVKYQSPEFILPKLQDYDRDKFLTEFEKVAKEISAAIQELDLTKTCMEFEFPGIGHLTRLEAVHFVIYHTQRHNHQLAEIKSML